MKTLKSSKVLTNLWHKLLVMAYCRKDTFYYEPFIYVDADGKLCRNGMTTFVKFLQGFKVEAYTEAEADFKARRIVKEKYPEYAGSLWFW